MRDVAEIVLPVFAIILLGYAARRRGRISAEGVRGLNDFVFLLALPALLFDGASAAGPAAGAGPVAIAFFSGCLTLYAVAVLLGCFGRRLSLIEAGLFGLDATYGNLVMIGVPIVLAAYGPDGLRTLLAIVGLHALIMVPVATLVAELGLNGRAAPWRLLRTTLRSLLRNPLVLAVALGGIWSLLLPPPPAAVHRLLSLLGAAGPPTALFCLGASLTGFDLRRDWTDALLGVALKLLALPLLVWGMARLLGLDPLGTAVAVTAAGMPTGANAFILARRYGTGTTRSGATVLLACALSVATLGGLLAVFRG